MDINCPLNRSPLVAVGSQVERDDAVFSVSRIAWLVLALQSGNVNNLRAGCEDKMHQPQRATQDAYKHVRSPSAAVHCTAQRRTVRHLSLKRVLLMTPLYNR